MSFEDQSYVVITGPNGRPKKLKPTEVRRELDRLNKARHAAEEKALDAAVEEQANEAKRIMIERTKGGEDYERKQFGALSPRYAVEKGSSKADLYRDGDLLNSVNVKRLSKGRYLLAFGNSFKKQVKGLATGKWPLFGNRAHMRTNPRPKRRAMGTVAKQDIEAVSKKGFRAFQRVIRKELKR